MDVEGESSGRRRMTWCIYVPRPATENFAIGRREGIWGVDQPDKVAEIEPGDEVLFVHDLAGARRLSLDDFLHQTGKAKMLVRAEVTS